MFRNINISAENFKITKFWKKVIRLLWEPHSSSWIVFCVSKVCWWSEWIFYQSQKLWTFITVSHGWHILLKCCTRPCFLFLSFWENICSVALHINRNTCNYWIQDNTFSNKQNFCFMQKFQNVNIYIKHRQYKPKFIKKIRITQ